MCVGMDGCGYGWVWVSMCVGMDGYVCGCVCVWVLMGMGVGEYGCGGSGLSLIHISEPTRLA